MAIRTMICCGQSRIDPRLENRTRIRNASTAKMGLAMCGRSGLVGRKKAAPDCEAASDR